MSFKEISTVHSCLSKYRIRISFGFDWNFIVIVYSSRLSFKDHDIQVNN